MLIKIKVNTSSSKVEIKESRFFEYEINLTKPAIDNQANKQLIQVLSDYFKTTQSNIRIKSGHKSKIKLIMIDI